jgi:hypothetical protein
VANNSFLFIPFANRHRTSEAGETFNEVQQLDAVSYRDADPEEIEKARRELEEEKKRKEGYVYKTSKACVQHSDKVIRAIDTAVGHCLSLFIWEMKPPGADQGAPPFLRH